jgi:isopropylmalate/homocitrate/citramalate synthase
MVFHIVGFQHGKKRLSTCIFGNGEHINNMMVQS